MREAQIIQGSPDLAITTWPLARAVALAGQAGTVSGAALPAVLARRLQLGDYDGHLRRAFEHFPVPGVARRVWERFFVSGGKPNATPFKLTPQPTVALGPALVEITALANFVEVFLAKEGHRGAVGIHYADTFEIPLLPSIYGALLAGVDYILAGSQARLLPGVLDQLLAAQAAQWPVSVGGRAAAHEARGCGFDPRMFDTGLELVLHRPRLLALVRSAAHADELLRLTAGRIDAFVLACRLGETQPDSGSIETLRAVGLPFWLTAPAEPGRVAEARRAGAAGALMSGAFAFCEESGLDPELKRRVIERCLKSPKRIFTDLVPSPAGFPLKILRLDGTLSQPSIFEGRARICDVGFLREVYAKPDGTPGYRCPGEPLEHYLEKGGPAGRSRGQRCLCNGLLASIGLGQIQSGAELERAIVPVGDDLRFIPHFLEPGSSSFTAAAVVQRLLA